MTTLKIIEGQDQIFNEAGFQIAGNHGPNLEGGLSPRGAGSVPGAMRIHFAPKIMAYDGVDYDKSSIHIEVSSVKAEDKSNKFSHFNVHVTRRQRWIPPTRRS